MGLDLILFPETNENKRQLAEGIFMPQTVLKFERDYRIFAQIEDSGVDEGVPVRVKTMPLPAGVEVWYNEDEGVVKGRTNPYGGEMVFAEAGELKKIQRPEGFVVPHNLGIMAYVNYPRAKATGRHKSSFF